MALNLQNLNEAKEKLNACNVNSFIDSGRSFSQFVSRLEVDAFRKIRNLEFDLIHPVTVIAGTNTVGKTSLLLLLACSHEKFLKHDSTSPSMGAREHGWSDMLSFTSHESDVEDYSYRLNWRLGPQVHIGWGKRTASSKSWSGLGKKSSDSTRINAKIRSREVRLIDLERVLPGRSFSNSLFRKANVGVANRLNSEIEQAFSYIFDAGAVEISEIASHVNKTCFLIKNSAANYSSFNAASGEESVLYLLKDIIDSPKNSLILIDEAEAGFHPAVQRKIADIIQYVSWRDKKQFVISSHSPTFISCFSSSSRVFIEQVGHDFSVTPKLPTQAIRSKMDSVSHPLLRLYCEDGLAEFLVAKALMLESTELLRIVNFIRSGPVDQVENDYIRHRRNFAQYRNKVGCCAILDGDYIADPRFSAYAGDAINFVGFIFPHEAPEKFLVRAYLAAHPNVVLDGHLTHGNHHSLFAEMVILGLATDEADARNACYQVFQNGAEYARHVSDIAECVARAYEFYRWQE